MTEYLSDPNQYFTWLNETLQVALGDPEVLHQSSPLAYCNTALDVLIATILTQATSDRNALKSWQNFKLTFPEPELVLIAEESALVETIRSGGLANQKAKTIREVLEVINQRLPGFKLEKLSPESVWQFLISLPGVGPKTAACVFLFGLKQPAFPVDTHIHRIAIRMGWIKANDAPLKAQQLLSSIIPPSLHIPLHILLLNLGRNYCRPRNPNCRNCPLKSGCKREL